MTSISHFRFISSRDDPRLQLLSASEYQNVRSHPDRQIKDRSEHIPPDTGMMQERVRRSHLQASARYFTLKASHTIKAVGYFPFFSRMVASTGTSKPGVLCVTDGMGVCIGVAIGGENIRSGVPAPSAKVRIFHVFPRNSIGQLGTYVKKLRDQGLTVKAAMNGGTYIGGPELFSRGSLAAERMSQNKAQRLRSLFSKLNVPLEIDEAAELRGEKIDPLGVVIRDDHTVQFVTELGQDIAPSP